MRNRVPPGSRARFQALFKDAHQRKFEVLVFWALDRYLQRRAYRTTRCAVKPGEDSAIGSRESRNGRSHAHAGLVK